MKTSLIIDDALFQKAQREAQENKKTLSETLSHWARIGYETLKKAKRGKRKLHSVNLGGASAINLNSRRDWMDSLDR